MSGPLSRFANTRSRLPLFHAGLAIASYAALAYLFFGPTHGGVDMIPGQGQDPLTFIWYLAWWPWAIGHGLNPLHSNFVWAPSGYNLLWGTSMPAAALLAAPITLTKGAVAGFGTLMVMAPCLLAFSGFLLIRQMTSRVVAALISGALIGFSSYETGQMLGHLNLVLGFPVPLMLLIVVCRVSGRISLSPFIALFAMTLLLEFGLSTEVFASLVSLGTIVWGIFVVTGPKDKRRTLLLLGFEILLAGLLCAVILLPYFLAMAKGASDFAGFINSPEMYSSDALNLIVPTNVTRLGYTRLDSVAAGFTGNQSEQGAYLGLPLLLIIVIFAGGRSRGPWRRPLLVSLVMLFVASLGPVLQVGGWNTHMPLPWALAARLPLIEGALPCRFSFYVALAAAISAGLWMSDARTGRGYALRVGLGVLACLFLLPNRHVVAWTTAPRLPLFEPARIAQEIGPDRTILLLPYGVTGPGMFWQVQADFGFRQAGGYLSFVPKSFDRLALVLQLFRGEPNANFGSDLASFCVTHDVSFIVAGPATPQPLVSALHGLGWPARDAGGATLFTVPSSADLHYVTLGGDTRPSGQDTWQLAGREVTVTTHETAAIVQLSNTILPDRAPLILTIRRGSISEARILPPQDGATVEVPANTTLALSIGRSKTVGDDSRTPQAPAILLRYRTDK